MFHQRVAFRRGRQHDTAFGSELCVLDVELDQRLGVLGDKGDWSDHDGEAFSPCPLDLVIGCGLDPLQRSDTALVASAPVELRTVEFGDEGFCRQLDVRLVGIAPGDNALRQTVR